jgi:hypothetical protein
LPRRPEDANLSLLPRSAETAASSLTSRKGFEPSESTDRQASADKKGKTRWAARRNQTLHARLPTTIFDEQACVDGLYMPRRAP